MKSITFKIICITAIIFGFSRSYAQTTTAAKVTGSLQTDAGKPADYASVSLLKATKDSAVVKGSLTNENGAYTFTNVKAGTYVIKASMVGHAKTVSKPFTVAEGATSVTAPVVQLAQASKNLQTVNVVSSRPLIERRTDRTVMNIENSVLAAGNSAMEILEKAPGVTVDKDDNISLNGKQGVTVMINDKLTYLSAAQLATLLRSTDGNTIQSVEIITNPSAKYDAAGNSGIINIKLKKNRQSGTNGNLSVTAAYGKHFRDNTSLQLNHKEGKFNFFANLSRGDSKRDNHIGIKRTVQDANSSTFFDQQSTMTNGSHWNNYRVGADFDMTKKNTIGVVASGYFNPEYDVNGNLTYIGTAPGAFNMYQTTNSGINQTYRNFAFNVNDHLQIDSTGQELGVDLDYSKFRNNSHAQYDTYFFNLNGSSAQTPLFLRNQTPSTIEIKTAKADYTLPLSKSLKMEAGFKLSDVKTDNDLQAQRNTGGGYVNDATLTNHFIYDEKIDAGYLNFNKSFKHNWSVQAGLRAEYTSSRGDLVTTNDVVNRHYLNFFPSVFINHTIDKKNEIGFNYSRRIDRPSYDNLNPFVYYLDQYTYSQGNSFLKPQYTNSFELNYTYNHAINLTLGYSRTTDVITEVILTDVSKKASFQTTINLRTQDSYNANFNTPFTIVKWWTGNFNASAFYLKFNSPSVQNGTLGSGVLDNGKLAYNGRLTNTFTFAKTWKAELMGNYQSSLVYAYFDVKPQYSIDAGISHSMWNKKANIKLSTSDIFNMRTNNVVSLAQNNPIDIHQKNETRVTRLTFTYNFGNNKIRARQHQTGAEEEKGRVKSNN